MLLVQFSVLEIWLVGWFIKDTCYWQNFDSSKSEWLHDSSKNVLLAQLLAIEIWLAGWFIKNTRYWHNFQSSKSDWLDRPPEIRVIGTIFSPRNLIGWMIYQRYVLLAQFSVLEIWLIGWFIKKYVLLAQLLALEIWLAGWFIKNTRYWHNFQSSKSDWLNDSWKIRVIGIIFSPRNLIGWMIHQK